MGGVVVVGKESELSFTWEEGSLELESEAAAALHFSSVQSSSHLLASFTHAGVM